MLFMILENINCSQLLEVHYFYRIIIGVLGDDHIFKCTKIISPKKMWYTNILNKYINIDTYFKLINITCPDIQYLAKCNFGITMIDQKYLLLDLFFNHNMSGDISKSLMAKPVLSRCTLYNFCHNHLGYWQLSLNIIILLILIIKLVIK